MRDYELPPIDLDKVDPDYGKHDPFSGKVIQPRSYKVALWIGFFYMWLLFISVYIVWDSKRGEKVPIYLVGALCGILPLILTGCFSWHYPKDLTSRYLITAIPGVLGFLLLYFLESFIPFLVVPRGVLVHIIGPPHPFDIIGQLFVLIPFVAWVLFYPIAGSWSASFLRHFLARIGHHP